MNVVLLALTVFVAWGRFGPHAFYSKRLGASLELLRTLGYRVAPRGGSGNERGRVRADPWAEPVCGVTGGDAVPASGLCPALSSRAHPGIAAPPDAEPITAVNRDVSGGDRAHVQHAACMSGRTRGSPYGHARAGISFPQHP